MMSSQHLRPLAAFMLVSLVCAMVMVRSIRAEGFDVLRPGGFAVVDAPHQVVAGSSTRDLDQAGGPAVTQEQSSAALRPSTAVTHAARATGSRETRRSARPPVASSPSPTGGAGSGTGSNPGGDTGGSTGGDPGTSPTQPNRARVIARLKERMERLSYRISQASGKRKAVLRQQLHEVRARLDEVRAGGSGEEPPSGPVDTGQDGGQSGGQSGGQDNGSGTGHDAGPATGSGDGETEPGLSGLGGLVGLGELNEIVDPASVEADVEDPSAGAQPHS